MKTITPSSVRLLLAAPIVCAAGTAFAKEARNDAGLPESLAKAHAVARAAAAALPEKAPCDIVAVTSEAKSVYSPRNDGAWRARPVDRPGADAITLTLKPKVSGALLRLDFPLDPTLPAQGPGLASNGNSVIGLIEITSNGKPLKARVFSSVSQSFEGRVAESALSGKGSGDNATGWELGGTKPARLVLTLDSPVSAGSILTVRLVAKTRWGAHVPGIVAASVMGGDALTRARAQADELRADFKKWSDALLAGLKRRAAISGAATALADAEPAALARAELLRSCGVEKVFEVATRKGGHAFLYAFLNDTEWLSSFLLGGVEGTGRCDFAQSLENLRLLHSRLDKAVWADPVLKRLACAVALESGACNRYRLVEGFELTRKAREDGLLHAGFDRLDVRAMRHAINLGIPAHEFRDWLEQAQFTAGEYLGACWAVPYTDPNTYGFSVQGWGFHDPLRHAYPTAKTYRSIGGVCGTLSRFGAGVAFAHGVPAFTVGQPGHCAYVVRVGDSWGTGNDVSGPHTNSWSAYEGVSFMTTNALLESVENAPEHARTGRMLWVARLQREAGMAPSAWGASYEQALAAQPLDYAAWLEYIKALETTPGALTPAQWLSSGMRAAKAFKSHHEAGWALTMRCFKNGETAVPKPADRVALLTEANRFLSQRSVPTLAYGYPMLGDFFNRQADWIGDPAQQVRFYANLLPIHQNPEPALNWVFGGVLGWGGARFAANPATAPGYAKVMGEFFLSQGDKADKGRIAGTVVEGMRKAAETGDAASYATWQAVARRILPPLTPAQVHLNAAHLAARPKYDAFPGTLLSATGMLRTSSASYDTPLSYEQILNGGALGYFDTANEPKPWAKLTLAGDGELSGIVLVNRYELPSEQPWDVPLKVEISTDDKTWTQVALIEKAAPVYRIDLRGKNLRARYIRIERQAPADATAQPGRLHMRNFLVFGRKLY